MATLSGRQISASYTELLKTSVAGGIDGELRAIEDGDATPAALQISTTGVGSSGTLAVTGATTLSSTLDVTGNVAVNTGKFNVTAASGNTTIAGTLAVTGQITANSALQVNTAAWFYSFARFTDGIHFAPGITFINDQNTGLYRVGEDQLGITAGGTLAATFASTITLASAVSCSSTLAVTGAATFNGAVTLGDAAADTLTLNGTLAGSPTTTAKATPTTSDKVLILDAAAGDAIKHGTVANIFAAAATKSAVTGSMPAAGATTNIAHTLAGTPQQVRVVLLCTDAGGDAGWAQNDEVNIENTVDASTPHPLFAVYVGSTNVSVVRSTGAVTRILNKSTGAPSTMNTTKWGLKAYSLYLA
jgi:hypothetical protein